MQTKLVIKRSDGLFASDLGIDYPLFAPFVHRGDVAKFDTPEQARPLLDQCLMFWGDYSFELKDADECHSF
jgi:hypothetical protein